MSFRETFPNLDRLLNQNDIKVIFGGLSKRDTLLLIQSSPKWSEFMEKLEMEMIQNNTSFKSTIVEFFEPYQEEIKELVSEVQRKRKLLKKEEEQKKAIQLVQEMLAQSGLEDANIETNLNKLSESLGTSNRNTSLSYLDLKNGILLKKGQETLQELLSNNLLEFVYDDVQLNRKISYSNIELEQKEKIIIKFTN